ncbi:MAG: aryl-sulfate sulfotransferase [Deltaproteobacteria bacterium]|nr:aryl-sulfate sulfotransferase [Deltaproteobacteria bacterium]
MSRRPTVTLVAAAAALVCACAQPSDEGPDAPAVADAPLSWRVGRPPRAPTPALTARTSRGDLAVTAARLALDPADLLRGVLHVTTSRPARVEAWLEDLDDGVLTAVPVASEARTEHAAWVLGLRGSARFRVVVRAEAGGRVAKGATAVVTTPPPPYWSARLVETVPRAGGPSQALTMMQIYGLSGEGPPTYVVVVDDRGRIVWRWAPEPLPLTHVEWRSDGTLLALDAEVLRVLDPLGDELLAVPRQAMRDADYLHHAVTTLPDGGLMILATELRTIGGYPATTPGGSTQDVVGDRLLELTPDGEVRAQHLLLDLLDPHRVTPLFTVDFFDPVYPGRRTRDWSHATSLAYDARSDALVASLRHQHQVVAVSRATGELAWVLGEGGDVPLEPGGSWFYAAHGVRVGPDDHVTVFDNGVGRPAPGAPWSRAVEYALDRDGAGEVVGARQVWQWRGATPFFSPIFGSVERLPGGLVLVNDGGHGSGLGGWARVVEVTHDEAATVVHELTTASSPPVWSYRAQRIPSLYPPEPVPVPPWAP